MLHEMLQVNDRVYMKMDPEARSWGREGVPDGTQGTVIGKERITRYYSRIGIDAPYHGVWEQDGVAIVKWDTGEEGPTDGYSIYLVDPIADAAARERHSNFMHLPYFEAQRIHRNAVRISDLPETPFYEYDVVQPGSHARLDDRELMRVRSIMYTWVTDKQPAMVYQVDGLDRQGNPTWCTYLREYELELVERGNVYKHYHNQPLTFKDLREEAEFAALLQKRDELRNPKYGNYKWTKEDALEAIRTGVGDSMSLGGLFGVPSISVYRFHDRDLGERVRKETCKGFDLELAK